MLCMKHTATERNEKIEFFEATWDFASETFTLPHKMPNERKEIHRMNKRKMNRTSNAIIDDMFIQFK